MGARLEALGSELMAWRGSAEAAAAVAQQAQGELQARASEMGGASAGLRRLADLLGAPGPAPSAVTSAAAPQYPGHAGLQFHPSGSGSPNSPGARNVSPGRSRSPGRAKRGDGLPHLKTRAVYGASLRQSGDSPGIPAHLPTLGGTPGGRALQHDRSTLSTAGSGVAWAASGSADRASESQRDAVRVSHMARWGA